MKIQTFQTNNATAYFYEGKENLESDFTPNSQINIKCTVNERAKTIKFLEQRRKIFGKLNKVRTSKDTERQNYFLKFDKIDGVEIKFFGSLKNTGKGHLSGSIG